MMEMRGAKEMAPFTASFNAAHKGYEPLQHKTLLKQREYRGNVPRSLSAT